MRTAIKCPSEKVPLLLCDAPLLDGALLLPCSFGRVGHLLGRVPVTYAVSSWAESRNHFFLRLLDLVKNLFLLFSARTQWEKVCARKQ